MDQVIPGLWIGDLPSALDVATLKKNHIYSILSAMRGRITINETFMRHQILLDDTEDEDILVHLSPSIHFIQAELDKGRGVLVHCQAGVSRSAAIVAAYLMYSKGITAEAALEMIRKARPYIEYVSTTHDDASPSRKLRPNEGFMQQLEIFHAAQFKISRGNKTARMYYMQRAVNEVMNGDGSLPETDMFAKYPRTPNDSTPPTPGGPRRRIRCKMCRQELATREHMLDHGQLGPPTPAARTPAQSRRPSSTVSSASRRPSMTQATRPTITPLTEATPRRPSLLGLGSLDSLTMSPLASDGVDPPRRPPARVLPAIARGGMEAALSMSALESDDSDPEEGKSSDAAPMGVLEASKLLGRQLSDAIITTPPDAPYGEGARPAQDDAKQPLTTTIDADLVMHITGKLRSNSLRSPPISPLSPLKSQFISPPILANPKCSGYFVEPMKWMEPFLEAGQMAGKIVCPNKKCGAKLGNYDWAGVNCGCKAWVTPGFCINRSKVDEIV
ncbi:hypothetical protein BD779DRAFT_325060 [Infundibulicybe gibba]|nr:hypothetical protein BD779DRAFT_325060 [Infundibulicybe gibba]